MTVQGSDPSRDTSLSLAAPASTHPSAGDRAWIGARMPGLLPDTHLQETCSVTPACRRDNAAPHPWRTL